MVGQSIDDTTAGKSDIELPRDYHKACIDALAKLHATQEIARFLNHRSSDVRLRAAWQLFMLGEQRKAVDALIAMSYNPQVGYFDAAKMLCHPMLKDQPTTKAALKALAD